MKISRIEEFLKKLEKAAKKSDIQLLCNLELDYLRNVLNIEPSLNEFGYPVGVTNDARRLKTQVSHYRNAIKKIPLNKSNSTEIIVNGELSRKHHALQYFNLTDYEKRDVKTRDKARVFNDRISRPTFDHENVIDKALNLLDSSSYVSKVAGLYLLTGRRHSEILVTGHFDQPIFSNIQETIFDDWLQCEIDAASFSGQVKTKDKVKTAYNIPILTSLTIVQKTIEWLRVNKPHKVGERPKGSSALGEKVRKEFELTGLIPRPSGKSLYLNPHNLRSAYCAICWKFYREYKQVNLCTEDIFIKSIMGHIENGCESAQSYQDYHLN